MRLSGTIRKKVTHLLVTALTIGMLLPWPGGEPVSAAEGSPSEPPAQISSGLDNPLSNLYGFIQEQLGLMYFEVLQEWTKNGAVEAKHSLTVKASDYSAKSEAAEVDIGNYGDKSGVLIWKSKRESWIEYVLDIPETGLYEMAVEYHSYQDPRSQSASYQSISIGMEVDGKYPFREARTISFPRYYRDTLPLKLNDLGDHIRPRPIEMEQWTNMAVYDYDHSYTEPLKWYFTEGEHTLRLRGSAPIVLNQLMLRPPAHTSDYEAVQASYPSVASPDVEPIKLEAETMEMRNKVSVQMLSDQAAFMSPMANGAEIFNAVGGMRWSDGGETVQWAFEAPQSGIYQIALRELNNSFSNKTTFRKISIDGEVPFEELQAYSIPYSTKWRKEVLSDEQNKPFKFYLEKGIHTISITSTYSPLKEVQTVLEQVNMDLGIVSRDLQALTKGAEDPNRTWDIVKNFPEIPARLESVMSNLEFMAVQWLIINGETDNNVQTLNTAISDLEKLIEHPDDIPKEKATLSIVQTKVNTLTNQIRKQPLTLDYLLIAPYDQELPRMTATLWEKLVNMVMNFFRSFSEKNRLGTGDENVLHVWMNYGRDHVNLLQELANQYFTPTTGIKVQVDILPREDLLVLANAANRAPDVALGIGEGRPSEFAFRDAAVDLSQFPGFDEVVDNFAPGALLAYYYNGGYYALPEAQHFKLLYYRKDILDHLGLKVPDTWEDVYRMLPALQQNGYNFFLPQDYLTFVYQNQADFYAEDGMRTGLESPEGFRAFKQLTDFYRIYGMDRQVARFYQHFRDGTMPIGISDLNTYLELKAAAPELDGWWGMAPIPGYRNEQGTVERWSGGNIGMLAESLGGFGGGGNTNSGAGSQQAAMIMKKADNKDEGWQFIKWWLSADIQQIFGNELEGFYGESFRWNTANLAAFVNLPWTQEELSPILEQWRWYKSMVNVPGSYFIPRELQNAWNRTVLNGMNYRSSLEEAILNINRELMRKQQEFGYRDELGNMLKSFNLPIVDEPWKGAEANVND